MRSTLITPVMALLAGSLSAQAVWSRIYPAVVPPPRYDAAMAAFESTGDLILFSGQGSTILNDAWTLQGNQWVAMTGPLPPARSSTALVYDAYRQRLVMFGGTAPSVAPFGDTWEWQPSGWTPRLLAHSPPARWGHAMAYDRERQVVVLFGGTSGPLQRFGDTWEFDGTDWTQRQPSQAPAGRQGHRMAFDPVNRCVLLFGGTTQVGNSGFTTAETWLWDGTDWQQSFPVMHPTYRSGFAMTADLHRGRVLLHGGSSADSYAWEWNGNNWEMRQQPSPTAFDGSAMAYSNTVRRIVMFGGYFNLPLNDIWVFQTPNPANALPFGNGCASSAGVPELANAPYTYPWLGDTYTSELRNLPAATSPVIFFSGFTQVGPIDLGPLGMPGCQQWVDLTFSQPAVAVAGVATWTVAVPNVTALSGLHLFQQGAVLAPGTNTLGAVVSNALDLTAGIR